MSEKLLPCPFCGSEAGIAGDGTSWEVGCSADECYVSMFDINRERAIVSWNKRATDTLPTYYLLRRTVGEVTKYNEYWCARDAEWTPFQRFATLFDRKTELGYFIENLSGIYPMEIIPVKLMEVAR